MKRPFVTLLALCCALGVGPANAAIHPPLDPAAAPADSLDRTARQWSDCIEWAVPHATWEGNPFDVEARVTFTHETSATTITTGMFFVPPDSPQAAPTWRFRFTGVRPGRWTFQTHSGDPQLDGHRGAVTVEPNDAGYGFVVACGDKWGRQRGRDSAIAAFSPQYVMFGTPRDFHQRPDRIDAAIQTFLVEHGFTGFHVMVFCQWFDLDHDSALGIKTDDPNPDPRTFEALESLITRTHAAGGVVHLWFWGDQQRGQTPARWGINGKVDRRLQRYIAARLGPLPGWTAGYGFDLWEWVDGDQLTQWHRHMNEQFGWPHLLGARSKGRSRGRAQQLSPAMDYASFEDHRPDLVTYRRMLEDWPGKPAFAEDRFRVRDVPRYWSKDYDESMTRRGLWQSTMAGGVANIWGYLLPADGRSEAPSVDMSQPYPHAHWIRTWADFFQQRFSHDLRFTETLGDGPALASDDGQRLIFYRESAAAVRMDLSGLREPAPAVAVDPTQPYAPLDLGLLEPRRHVWAAPHLSDWAIAVGYFDAPTPAASPARDP